MDNPTEDASENISPLDNSLVVRRILSHFSTQELLNLSTVNKLWNYEARSLLRDHRRCVVYIKGPYPCAVAKSLNDQLTSMKVIPFNALVINTESDHICDWELVCASREGVCNAFPNLLRLPLKELIVSVPSYPSCPADQLAVRLLTSSWTLARLEIPDVPLGCQKVKEQHRPGSEHGLPMLKTVKLALIDFDFYLAQILRTAPNLEMLENTVEVNVLKLIPPEKLNVVKSIDFRDDVAIRLSVSELLRVVEKFCACSPKLLSLKIVQPEEMNLGWKECRRYWTLLTHITHSSCQTLKSLTLDLFAFSKLVNHKGPTFPYITNLEFQLLQGDNAGIRRYLLSLPLQRIFPSVTEVSFSPGHHGAWENLRRFWRLRPHPKIPWPAVTKVNLKYVTLSASTMRDLGHLFPNLKSLTASVCFGYSAVTDRVPFPLLWSTWPTLQHLEFTERFHICLDDNFDAAFCGIYPDEVRVLSQMDDVFLKRVNIVPPFPAITHLRGLQKFNMQIELGSVFPGVEAAPRGSFFLSKVAALVAFKRMDNFQFYLTAPTEAYEGIRHLRKFVEVELRPRKSGSSVDSLYAKLRQS